MRITPPGPMRPPPPPGLPHQPMPSAPMHMPVQPPSMLTSSSPSPSPLPLPPPPLSQPSSSTLTFAPSLPSSAVGFGQGDSGGEVLLLIAAVFSLCVLSLLCWRCLRSHPRFRSQRNFGGSRQARAWVYSGSIEPQHRCRRASRANMSSLHCPQPSGSQACWAAHATRWMPRRVSIPSAYLPAMSTRLRRRGSAAAGSSQCASAMGSSL